ncbi:hypothetical protein ACIQJW_08140 [Streptomyces californicus]|uniref:hypothetical protein n=1 Tax=Streptomyces californicus TaxID=67351 RepID=UPI00382D3CF9
MTAPCVVRVAPALRPLEHLLVSGRHRRAARRWPWAWWCTTCDTAYGAAKTEAEATAAADAHATPARTRAPEEPTR